MLDQDNNIYVISLSILITCLLDNVWILWGEVTCQSLLGVKRLTSKLTGVKLKADMVIILETKICY